MANRITIDRGQAENDRIDAEIDFQNVLKSQEIMGDKKRKKRVLELAKKQTKLLQFVNANNLNMPNPGVNETKVPKTKVPKAKNVKKIKGASGKSA